MVKVRSLQKDDINQVAELHRVMFDQEFAFDAYVDATFYHGLVLLIDEKIVGYLVGQIIFEMADLYYVAVLSGFNGKGYGQRLVVDFIEKARQLSAENVTLEVRVKNQAAIRLYEKCGFDRETIRKSYYEDGEDALLMIKPLK